jgi:[ribosomal protein S5]-alanine N-acetyltransferase
MPIRPPSCTNNAFDVLGARAVVSCTVRHSLRSRAVTRRIGMRHVGEIYSRGTVRGEGEERDDAPFAVCLMLAGERSPLTFG